MPKYLSDTSSGKAASAPQERRIPTEKALPSLTQLWRLRGAHWQYEVQGKSAVLHSSCILLSIFILLARAVMSEEGGVHKTDYCPGILEREQQVWGGGIWSGIKFDTEEYQI